MTTMTASSSEVYRLVIDPQENEPGKAIPVDPATDFHTRFEDAVRAWDGRVKDVDHVIPVAIVKCADSSATIGDPLNYNFIREMAGRICPRSR